MPFDGSGNFTRSYNFVQDKTNGIKIVASRMDGEFDNFASAMNQVFMRTGIVPMSGSLNMATNVILGLGSGIVGTPAIRFNADSTSGLYMPASGRIALVAGGTNRIEAHSTGASIAGSLTSSGRVIGSVGFTSGPAGGGEGGELLLQSTSGGNGLLFDVDSANIARIHNYANTQMRFFNNSAQVAEFGPSGGLGIGRAASAAFAVDAEGVGRFLSENVGAIGVTVRGRSSDNVSVIRGVSNDASTENGRLQFTSGHSILSHVNGGGILLQTGGVTRLSADVSGNVNVPTALFENSIRVVTAGANSSITSLSGLTTPLSVAQGGTGANNAVTARGNLGLGSLATLSTINNSNWSGTALAVANGGTGATTASGARTALSAAVSGANGDITSLTGLTTPLSVAQGGTGVNSVSGVYANTTGIQTFTNKTLTGPVINGTSISTSGSVQIDSAPIPAVAGSAPLYMPRTWARFNGTTAALYGSGNIASIVRNSAGTYTVTFTTAMPDANYMVMCQPGDAGSSAVYNRGGLAYALQTTGFKCTTFVGGSGAGVDFDSVNLIVVR